MLYLDPNISSAEEFGKNLIQKTFIRKFETVSSVNQAIDCIKEKRTSCVVALQGNSPEVVLDFFIQIFRIQPDAAKVLITTSTANPTEVEKLVNQTNFNQVCAWPIGSAAWLHLETNVAQKKPQFDKPVKDILILEDEEEMALLVEKMLQINTHAQTIVRTNSAHKALEALEQARFKVIIADAHLKHEEKGADFLKHAWKTDNLTTRIMLTSDHDPTAINIAIKRGRVDKFLFKPVDKEDFHSRYQSKLTEEKELKNWYLAGITEPKMKKIFLSFNQNLVL